MKYIIIQKMNEHIFYVRSADPQHMSLSIENEVCGAKHFDTEEEANNYKRDNAMPKDCKVIPIEMTGAHLIAVERFEQMNKHGFQVTDDQYYGNGELVDAALFSIAPNIFPFPAGWNKTYADKIKAKDRIGQLKVAGAFIAAEIDRQLLSQ